MLACSTCAGGGGLPAPHVQTGPAPHVQTPHNKTDCAYLPTQWQPTHAGLPTTLSNRPFLHKDFGCPEACLMAAPSGCSVFQLYLNSRK